MTNSCHLLRKISHGLIYDFLGFKRSQLKGVGSLTEDGEERISSRPPRLTSVQRIYESDNKIRKPLVAWWKSASDNEHEAMIRLLSNTVDIDKVREDVAYASAIEFIDGLDDDALTKLDSVDLPSGRAAYSVETLQKLTRLMMICTKHVKRCSTLRIVGVRRQIQLGSLWVIHRSTVC